MINGTPLITLEIQEMKQTILHHFNAYQRELSEQIELEIDKVIKEFNFAAVINTNVQKVVTKEIERYFDYGGDGHVIVKNAIRSALNSIFETGIKIE